MPGKALFVHSISLFSLIAVIQGADPTFLSVDCGNSPFNTTPTYAPNSSYKTNLNTLLSTLSANSNNASNGFYNFTAGSAAPDVAYGFFLCRGDINATACRECVAYAAGEVVKQCPGSKRVTIWYDPCLLSYSNKSIFYSEYAWGLDVSANNQNVTDGTVLTRFWERYYDELFRTD